MIASMADLTFPIFLFDDDLGQKAVTVEKRILEWDDGEQLELVDFFSTLRKNDDDSIVPEISSNEKVSSLAAAMDKLNDLIGLFEVKEEVKKLKEEMRLEREKLDNIHAQAILGGKSIQGEPVEKTDKEKAEEKAKEILGVYGK